MLRDRLVARLAQMGEAPDHQRLVAEVLGIRNAPPELARRLIAQALVLESREDAWRAAGERVLAAAPDLPAVYMLKDEAGAVVYVGKAVRLRRRLRAHFARRRWTGLKAGMARIAGARWRLVGSELEALVREAELIRDLQPSANVQVGVPALATRGIPRALVRDLIVVVPSVQEGCAELVAARPDGAWMILRTRRNGADLVAHTSRLMRFFHSPLSRAGRGRTSGGEMVDAAPIVFSWLAGRGSHATRLDPLDAPTRPDLAGRLAALLADDQLFTERLDQRWTRASVR